MDEAYRSRIERFRKEKDEAFRKADWSPVQSADRERFGGLAYYAVDPAYRFEVMLDEEPVTRLEIPLSTGGTRAQERLGTFAFALPEGEVRLAVYRNEDDASLFLPFRDATSGKETYGAGRYLDLHGHGSDPIVVDFNLAYNPYCAYSEEYACPLPPPENWVQVPVRAGEKAPPTP